MRLTTDTQIRDEDAPGNSIPSKLKPFGDVTIWGITFNLAKTISTTDYVTTNGGPIRLFPFSICVSSRPTPPHTHTHCTHPARKLKRSARFNTHLDQKQTERAEICREIPSPARTFYLASYKILHHFIFPP